MPELNEEFSYRDFCNQSLRDVDVEKLNGTVIRGSCFYNTEVNANIFPDGMTGVTFEKCNLDNVIVPQGNTVLDNCTNVCIKPIDENGELVDWVIDCETLEPIRRL